MTRSANRDEEITRSINRLAAMPSTWIVVIKEDAQRIMLETQGQLLACGSLYKLILTDLGADTFKITLASAHEDRGS